MTPLDPLAIQLHGTNLIEASAGTGKTYTIATLYLRLLLEQGLAVNEILVVTYTNAATAELRSRIRNRLRQALAALEAGGDRTDATLDVLVRGRFNSRHSDRRIITAALQGFDEAAIFTIHGFCQRMLQENAFESGVAFDTQLVTDQTPLQLEVLYDFWSRELHAAPAAFVRYLRERKITADRLSGLARMVVAQPDMPVVAQELPQGRATEDLMAAWHTAYTHAATVWQRQRDTVLALLCAPEKLNRAFYREGLADQWGPAMDALLSEPMPGVSVRFDKFKWFTSHGLRDGTKKGHTPPEHPFFVACDALMTADQAVLEHLNHRAVQLRLDLVQYARRETRRRKERSHTQSFDDLLHRLRDALERPDGDVLARQIRRRFRAALIDEFQDTDPVQYQVFRRIYHQTDAALFLIGDPKQAIYAFRGADVFTYMHAKRDAQAQTYTLGTNYRSDPRLVHAINTLFSRARAQFVFDDIQFLSMHPAPDAIDALGGAAAGRASLELFFLRSGGQELTRNGWIKKEAGAAQISRSVAAEIARLVTSDTTITDRRVEPGDIAVLCRTNDQARGMQLALRAVRVPSVLLGDDSVFDAPEALDLERVLGAMADPGDLTALRAALSTPMMGVSGEALHGLQSAQEWDERVEQFHSWHDVWLQHGFMPAFRRMLDEQGVQPRLLELTDGERRLTNVLHLGELLQTAGAEAHRGPLTLVEWLRQMRHDAAARADLAAEAAQIRLESDARAVKLVTIHKSKGLEYPIVYCPFLWDGRLLRGTDEEYTRFHDPDDADRLKLDVCADPGEARRHKALAQREALAESLRLLYVALTRAKHRCTVVWGRFNEAESSALGYLLHQPPARDDSVDLAAATKQRILSLDDAGLLADLEALQTSSNGTIAVDMLSLVPAAPYTVHHEARELHWRDLGRNLHLGWRTSSFSGLVAAAGPVSPLAEEGIDHDEMSDALPPEAASPPRAPVVLHEFPAGAQAGQLVHEILQYTDFQVQDPQLLASTVETRLARYGFEPRWREPLCQAIEQVLDTPLHAGQNALRLRHVAVDRRLNEMEFTFPVAGRAGEAMLTAARLARAFARFGGPSLPTDYAEQVRRLGFAPIAGYLRGFIDLAFEHGGRWYVVDYKSNWLGPDPDDYRVARLADAMRHRHYFLQYHLYAVALHRYLTVRLPTYDYERCFGGAYYLFVRGMSPAYGADCGVFFDRPARALIEGLSSALDRPEADS